MAGLTWREGRIVVALVAFCTLCQASQAPNYKCFPFSDTQQGTIEPIGDIIREVGTSYEASCLFDPNQVRAEEVFFMHWGKTPKDQYRIQHKVVNDSTISIQVTHEEATEYKLRCLKGNTTFLCERTVKFGYMPQDVKNFTCISKNWTKLNCTWTTPENPVTVRYQLTYVVLGFLDSRDCPKSQKGINWCYWGENDFNDRDTWVMTLTAKNALNQKGVQFEHRISVYENVLPDPPEKLVAKVNGPYEVNVTWKLPHPIDVFIGGIVHEVSYRERQDGDQSEKVPWVLVEHKMVMPDRFKTETFSHVISNLHAYIRYDFRVRLHTGTGPIRQHMWSDAAIHTERTAATRPTKAPLTDIGTFEIEETLSHRDIYISWQMVDKLFWNGPNFYYNVSAFEFQTNRPVIKISHEVDIRDAYAKFTNMDKDIAYRFEIIPMNDEGSPDNDLKSVVVVPEMMAILKPIKYFKVFAYGDSNNYSLRWGLPESQQENQKIESVSLYWCKKDKYEERCQNKLEWVTVEDLNITSKNLTDLKNSSLYMFGISANSNSSSSGIKWHTCIASHGSRPPPLEQFEVTHVSPTEVNLKWMLDCKAKAAEPTGFNISYCRAVEMLDSCPLEAGMTYEKVPDETTVEHLVRNLHPYTNYIFNIAILTEIGLSKWSSSVRVQTKADKPSGSPRQLEARAKGQGWVLLAWQPPRDEERNGRIVKYIVNSEPLVKQINVMANTTSDVTMYNVTGLEPYTKYVFKVTPCTEGPRSELCGEEVASLDVRTRIGAPGKIESIDQEDQQLEWEHDECNAPQCSYELRYRMNGTDHQYISAPGQSAANFKDMNITCTEHQVEIKVGIRAISINEDDTQLTGPWKEKMITCHIPGSYRYDRVPSISINLQTVLVQLPPSNQYSTIFNFLRIPNVGIQQSPLLNTYSLVQAQGPVLNDNLSGISMEQIVPDNGNIRQTLVNDKRWSFNSNGGVPVTSRDVTIQPLEEGDKRHPAWYGNRIGGNNKQQLNDARNMEELHVVNGNGNPFLLNRNADQLDNMNIYNSIIDNYTPLKDSIQSSLSSTAPLPQYSLLSSLSSNNRVLLEDSNPTGFTSQDKRKAYQVSYRQKSPSTGRQSNEHNAGHQDITSQEIPDHLKISNSNANCPLIELMKTKGVEVNFSTSSGRFELNIKGHGGFYDLLQSIYHHSHVHKSVSDESEIEPVIKTGVANVSISSDSEGNTDSKIDNGTLEQHTSEQRKKYDVTVPENQTVPNFFVIHSFTTVADQTHIVEETTPNHVFHENSSVIDASHYTSMENQTDTTSALSIKETVELINNRSQILGEFHSELIQSNSTVTPVVLQDDVGKGTGGVPSRRNPETLSIVSIQATPLQAVPNSQLSVMDLLQGRHSSLNTLTSQNMEVSKGADKHEEVMNGNTNEVSLDNEKENVIKVKEMVEEPQMIDNSKKVKDMEGQQIMEISRPTASIIYHLELMGPFNGDVGNIVPALTNKHTIPLSQSSSEEINDVSVAKNTISRPNSHSVIINGGESDKNTNLNAKGHQHNTHCQSDCPFRGLMEAQDTKIYINTSEAGGFEIKFQGNESLYGLVGQIFHSANAILDNAEGYSLEEESVSLNHLVHGYVKSPQPVQKVHTNDSTSTDLAVEEILANNRELATSAITDESAVVQNSVNMTDGFYILAEHTAEQLHATEEQTQEQVTTEATVLASTSDVLLSEYTTDIENISETYITVTETTSGEVTFSSLTNDVLEGNYSTHTRSSQSEYSTPSQASEEVNSTKPGDQTLTLESPGVSMTSSSHPLEDDGATSTGTPWPQNEVETMSHHTVQSESTISTSPTVNPNMEIVPTKS